MALFDNPLEQRILLVELQPYDVVNTTVVTRYLASEQYITEPTDTPANTNYKAVIQDGVRFRREMYAGATVGGRSIPDRGSITIINTKEGNAAARFEEWLDPNKFTWDNRSCCIYLIAKGDTHANKTMIFDGVIDGISFEENTITFRLRSKEHLLDRLIQEKRYAGTGDDEGNSTVENLPVPLCFGQCFNIEPLLIDPAQQIFQFHDGAIQAIDAVRDKGVALTATNNVATYAALKSESPSSGQYATSTQLGLIKAGGTLAGRLTADVRGSTLGGTYSALFGSISSYIVQTYATITSVDSSAISAMDVLADETIGIYIKDDRNILDVLDEMANSVGGFYGFNRAGQFDVGRLDAPASTPDLSISETDIIDNSLSLRTLGVPVWKLNCLYKRNFTPQSRDELAGGVSESNRQAYGLKYLTETSSDAAVKTKFLNALEVDIPTNIFSSADAAAFAQNRREFYDDKLQIVQADTNLKPLNIELNQTVKITHPRFNLENGKNFVIIGFTEDYLTGRVQITGVG